MKRQWGSNVTIQVNKKSNGYNVYAVFNSDSQALNEHSSKPFQFDQARHTIESLQQKLSTQNGLSPQSTQIFWCLKKVQVVLATCM